MARATINHSVNQRGGWFAGFLREGQGQVFWLLVKSEEGRDGMRSCKSTLEGFFPFCVEREKYG